MAEISRDDTHFLYHTLRSIQDKIPLSTDPEEAEFKLPTPKEIYDYLDERVVGQDRAKKIISVGAHNHYKRLLIYKDSGFEKKLDKTNLMLIGPTGSGKTYLVKQLGELLKVPVFIGDANGLTAAGYVGKDVDTLIEGLINNCDGNLDAAATGIVFIDEFDKICKKGISGGRKDVGGESVQQALLKLIEGTEIEIEKSSGMAKYKISLDTSNILFIVGGSFVGLEDIIAKRTNSIKRGIGFDAEVGQQEPNVNLIHGVIPEDLENFGFIPEVLGRIPLVATLDELQLDDLVSILTNVKNSVVEQYKQLFEYSDLSLEFTKQALYEIAKEAQKRKTGARALKTIVEEVLLDKMFNLESAEIDEKDVKECFNTIL